MLHRSLALLGCLIAGRLAAVDALQIAEVQVPTPVEGEFDNVRFPPDTVEQVVEDYGGVSGLCSYWGWKPLAPGAPRPRIFYGMLAGNNGQTDVYEAHFVEISPFVSRIVAADPAITFQGEPRNLSLDMSLPSFQRFGGQLRHVVVESPTPGKTKKELSSEDVRKLVRPPGKPIYSPGFAYEQWTRAQIARGFKDAQGKWEMNDDDIVVVSDSDEIIMRHTLAALQLCEVPQFAQVLRSLRAGVPPDEACGKAKVIMFSQVYEYFADCPTARPLWWHPDAAPAACLMRGTMDPEDLRTSMDFSSTVMTRNIAARHLHNVGMHDEDLAFKYGHYSEPVRPGFDSGLDLKTNQEMAWRGCDPKAPDIGPGDWHMDLQPFRDFTDAKNRRGYSVPADRRRGLEMPLRIFKDRPELADKLLWQSHGEKRNPFVGKQGGTRKFDHFVG